MLAAPKGLKIATSEAPTTVATTVKPTGRPGRNRRLKRLRKGRNETVTAALRKKGLQALHALQADDNSIHYVPVGVSVWWWWWCVCRGGRRGVSVVGCVCSLRREFRQRNKVFT